MGISSLVVILVGEDVYSNVRRSTPLQRAVLVLAVTIPGKTASLMHGGKHLRKVKP